MSTEFYGIDGYAAPDDDCHEETVLEALFGAGYAPKGRVSIEPAHRVAVARMSEILDEAALLAQPWRVERVAILADTPRETAWQLARSESALSFESLGSPYRGDILASVPSTLAELARRTVAEWANGAPSSRPPRVSVEVAFAFVARAHLEAERRTVMVDLERGLVLHALPDLPKHLRDPATLAWWDRPVGWYVAAAFSGFFKGIGRLASSVVHHAHT